MPVRENGRRSPVRRPPVPSQVPSHPQTAAKVRGFSLTAPGFTTETGCWSEPDSNSWSHLCFFTIGRANREDLIRPVSSAAGRRLVEFHLRRLRRRQVASAIWPFGELVRPRENISLASQTTEWRMPRKRPSPAAISASSTRHTVAEAQVGVPDDAGAQRLLPNCPLALIAAVPLTNSISPTGFISVGPSARYIEPHSTKTVCVML